jgi:hypothetical protein
MNTYNIHFMVTVEATNHDDAEEIVIELLESDPAIESWHIIPAEAIPVV